MRFLFLFLFAAAISGDIEAQTPAPKAPFFQLDGRAKRALVEKASTVKAGDSYQNVTDKLGRPTRDEKWIPKESNRVGGRTLSYYAVILKEGSVNELLDELVHVFFDEHDRVKSVYMRVTLSD